MSATATYTTATQVPAEEDEPNPLLPHTSELIVGAIAFVLLYLFLRAKVFPVFEKVFAARREAIEGGMERARSAEEEAAAALAQYRQQLAEARHEAARLREEAREQGAVIIAEMREQAQGEARRITESAHQQIETDKSQALTQLRMQVGTIATDLAGRILGESLQEEVRQSRVVDRFLAELESRADAGGGGGGEVDPTDRPAPVRSADSGAAPAGSGATAVGREPGP